MFVWLYSVKHMHSTILNSIKQTFTNFKLPNLFNSVPEFFMRKELGDRYPFVIKLLILFLHVRHLLF